MLGIKISVVKIPGIGFEPRLANTEQTAPQTVQPPDHSYIDHYAYITFQFLYMIVNIDTVDERGLSSKARRELLLKMTKVML